MGIAEKLVGEFKGIGVAVVWEMDCGFLPGEGGILVVRGWTVDGVGLECTGEGKGRYFGVDAAVEGVRGVVFEIVSCGNGIGGMAEGIGIRLVLVLS